MWKNRSHIQFYLNGLSNVYFLFMFWEIRGRQNEENSLLNVVIKIQMMSPHGFQALNEVLEFRDKKKNDEDVLFHRA